VDYCRQIRAMGGEVWYSPAGECIDYVGQSFKQVERGAAQNYFKQSMLKYFRKWQPRWQYLILKIAWPAGGIMIRAADKLKFESKAKT